jgi:hypothetical protein
MPAGPSLRYMSIYLLAAEEEEEEEEEEAWAPSSYRGHGVHAPSHRHQPTKNERLLVCELCHRCLPCLPAMIACRRRRRRRRSLSHTTDPS